jgi:hypothetical protein
MQKLPKIQIKNPSSGKKNPRINSLSEKLEIK